AQASAAAIVVLGRAIAAERSQAARRSAVSPREVIRFSPCFYGPLILSSKACLDALIPLPRPAAPCPARRRMRRVLPPDRDHRELGRRRAGAVPRRSRRHPGPLSDRPAKRLCPRLRDLPVCGGQ